MERFEGNRSGDGEIVFIALAVCLCLLRNMTTPLIFPSLCTWITFIDIYVLWLSLSECRVKIMLSDVINGMENIKARNVYLTLQVEIV